ncbi:AMP-binding protein [candidate division KSB1 bacterium]|nr:AMP-binding protein [candidate division KSB1 bacterium]
MIIELDKYTLRTLIKRSFQKFGALPAIAFVNEKPRTYAELENEVTKLAANLLSRGVQKGDKIAILGTNSPEWVIAYLATVYIGAVAVPILPLFPDADVRHIIRNSEAVVLFVAQKQRLKIEGMEGSSLHTIYSLENFSIEELQAIKMGQFEKVVQQLQTEIGKVPTPTEILKIFPEPEPTDLAAIIYTSGTTGHSKGVMLTHQNITIDVVYSIEKFPLTSDDRFLSLLPLSHTFEATGGMLCPLAAGVSIFYMEGLPTPQKLLTSMEQAKPTGVLTVPLVMDKIYRKKILPQIQSKKITNRLYQISTFRKLLNKVAGKKLIKSLGGCLRFFMFGGAALNEDVEIFLRDAKISYSTGYGMTETSPIMTINPFGKVRVGSCGQPIPGIEMKIHEPDPITKIGEIVIKGPIVMQGYYKNPEVTKQVFLDDEWLRTGDLGYFDNDGYLFIKGRSKNVIVGPSGENIYPEIVEQQILQSPYIQEVVVYSSKGKLVAKAYPDYDYLDQACQRDKLNETESKKAIEEILEKVRKEINEQLPEFSRISKLIEYPEPFEKTPTNKVKRYLYIPQEE